MVRVTLLAALLFATGCASALPPAGSPAPSPAASEATVPGKIAFGPEAAATHPYFIRVQEQIAAKWGFPLAAGKSGLEGDLLVELRIAKDGGLERVWLLRSSGVSAFDAAALAAVQSAQPFPPVPDEVARQAIAINATFRYRIEKK
jgi:protein TonB